MPEPSPALPSRSSRAHLGAALIAVLVFLGAAAFGSHWSRGLVAQNFEVLQRVMCESKADEGGDADKSAHLEHLKSIGTTLQREAFLRNDQLPLYGSSELVRPVPDRAPLFFRDQPDGFAVFSVGRAGTDSLLFLQNIAALGDATAGKRVALSLSPSWFCTRPPTEEAYLGNFSRMQALGALLNGRLSFAYRREFARRLSEHPAALESDRVLQFLVEHMAGRRWVDRAAYTAALPLARLQQAIETEQDHYELALYIRRRVHATAPPAMAERAPIEWDRLIADSSQHPATREAAETDLEPVPTGAELLARDQLFRDCVDHGPEASNLEFLLRGLRELGVKPLLLGIPPQEQSYAHRGISRKALAQYNTKIHSLAERWGADVQTFEDHMKDPGFLEGRGDHLSYRGWMYFNRALDAFYHNDERSMLTNGHNRHKRQRGSVVSRDA